MKQHVCCFIYITGKVSYSCFSISAGILNAV